MKKILFIIGIVVSMFATNIFAQEVRGIETRRVIYSGEEYDLNYCDDDYHYVGHGEYSLLVKFDVSNEYYGFEFKNLNSIPVSVTIEIYKKGNTDKMIDTKEIVLKSKETYIRKLFPEIRVYQGCPGRKDNKKEYMKTEGIKDAENYYVKYKAYKLL